MIYYRIVSRLGAKTHWKMIAGAGNLRDGVAYVEQNKPTLVALRRDTVSWEVGCTVPPNDTPQMRRSGSFIKESV